MRRKQKGWYANYRMRPDTKRVSTPKKVKCITTGEIFDSLTIAAEKLKISVGSISRSMRTEIAIKGLQFESANQ